MDRNEIEELIEWHEAEANRLADRSVPNVYLDKHQRSARALRHLLQAQTKLEKRVSDQRYRIDLLEDEFSHTDLDRIRLLRNDADLKQMDKGQLIETVVRLQEKYRYADLDGCVVGYVRDAAKKTFAGNCTFVDDDIHLLTFCARWALLNGIPDEMNAEIIPKAKAHLAENSQSQNEERASATPSEQQGTNDHDTE